MAVVVDPREWGKGIDPDEEDPDEEDPEEEDRVEDLVVTMMT